MRTGLSSLGALLGLFAASACTTLDEPELSNLLLPSTAVVGQAAIGSVIATDPNGLEGLLMQTDISQNGVVVQNQWFPPGIWGDPVEALVELSFTFAESGTAVVEVTAFDADDGRSNTVSGEIEVVP